MARVDKQVLMSSGRADRPGSAVSAARLGARPAAARAGAGARKNFLVRALVALAARRVRTNLREAARTEADALAAAGKLCFFEYRARRGAHGAAAEGVRAEVAVRARRRARGA